MITDSRLKELVRELCLSATCVVPADAVEAYRRAYQAETDDLARVNIRSMIDNALLAEKHRIPICSDTGIPLWYILLGTKALAKLESGPLGLARTIEEVTSAMTEEGLLQPLTMHPLFKGEAANVGPGIPYVNYKFADVDYLELTVAPKGAGAEMFGSFYKTLLYADGLDGVKRFVLDCVVEADSYGKACPPNVVGVGLGGAADQAMKLAKEAGVLRPIGDRNPDPRIAQLEEDLLQAINATGIGPAGMGGKTTALDVHIETAYSSVVALPAAVNIQCPAIHLATARIKGDGTVERRTWPAWFGR